LKIYTESWWIVKSSIDDLDKNIIARLEAKYLVNSWIHHELGISVTNKTAYRYFTTKKLYKGKFYFVPVSEYEEFMKE